MEAKREPKLQLKERKVLLPRLKKVKSLKVQKAFSFSLLLNTLTGKRKL